MNDFEARRQFITQRFVDGFKAGATAFVPVGFENRPFDQPDGAPWARFFVRESDRRNATVTTAEQRTLGIAYLQIFLPEGTGTKKARECADKMIEIFENQHVADGAGDFIFRTVNLTTVGRDPAGFYQMNATVEFQHDSRPA